MEQAGGWPVGRVAEGSIWTLADCGGNEHGHLGPEEAEAEAGKGGMVPHVPGTR